MEPTRYDVPANYLEKMVKEAEGLLREFVAVNGFMLFSSDLNCCMACGSPGVLRRDFGEVVEFCCTHHMSCVVVRTEEFLGE